MTVWTWAADQSRNPDRVSLRPRWAVAGTDGDVDRRTLHGFVLAACGGSRIPAQVHCNIDFASDAITIYAMAGGRDPLTRVMSPPPKESVRYEDVVAVQITGTTTRRSAGVIGGGFSVVGAAEGMLVAAAINAITTRTKIYTLLRIATTTAEYVFVSYSVDSSALQLSLTPVHVRIREAHSRGTPPASDGMGTIGQSIADEIRKFAALRADGLLTESEFAGVKARLLDVS